MEIAVLGNCTCRKGYPGSPSGCVDYRPLDCQAHGSGAYCPGAAPFDGVILPQQTAARGRAVTLKGGGRSPSIPSPMPMHTYTAWGCGVRADEQTKRDRTPLTDL